MNLKTASYILKQLGNDNINQQDREGKTALMVAAGAYNRKVNYSEIDFENSTPHDLVANKWTNEDDVKFLLEREADINVQDNAGRTALMFAAAWGGNGRIVQELLKHGAAINLQDNAGNTALDYAIEYWMCEEFWENPSRIAIVNWEGEFSVLKAWFRQWKNEGVVQLLLDNNASVNFFSNGSFPTPLIKMIIYEKIKMFDKGILPNNSDYKTSDNTLRIIERLISNNTIHIRDEDGSDALSLSASQSPLDIFKIVLKHSYNLNNQDNSGKTALMKLVSRSRPVSRYEFSRIDKLRLLLARKPDLYLEESAGMTALMLAVENSDSTLELQLLLDHGFIINKRSSKGKTALWYTNDEDKIRMLVKYKINMDAADSDGNTALLSAVLEPPYDVDMKKIEVLVKHGANIYIKNRQNETAVAYAIKKEDLRMLRVLLSQNKGTESDEELQDIMRYSLTGHWIFERTAEMLNILFESRVVNIDARNNLGQTLLIRAAQMSNPGSILTLILGMKPNLNLKDKTGKTALMYLAHTYPQGNVAATIKTLIEHGASTSITDNQGKTARDIAVGNIGNGLVKCVRECIEKIDDIFG